MRIKYVGSKLIKYDNVNDPQTPYIWSADNGYVVDVLPEHAERLLKHEDVWRKADAETPIEAEAPIETAEKGRRR